MAERIPQSFIDQLLNRIDIVDLIDSYVPLKKAGANYKACCPFHGEKTPSFTVSPSKQFYHCFGCGVNGSAIGFLMDYDHMEFRDAIEKLASSAGLPIPTESVSYQAKKTTPQGIDLYQLMTKVSDFYQHQLRQHNNKQEAIDYLRKRGLNGEIAKHFDLGFAPEGWDNLHKHLGQDKASEKALLDTGMLTHNEEKGRTYDRFRHRIMFPIHDHRGRVVGFGGRVLDQGDPKYLNSPETPIFHKGSELYGLYAARAAIKTRDSVLVVEGYMDVVVLAQHGIDHAVATLGTATTPMHLQRLFRHTHNIVFCFDGDRAGKDAAWKALQTSLPLLQDGYQISFLFLPNGEDPDSMVREVQQAGFEKLIEQATPLPEFLLKHLQQQADINRLDGRARLAALAKPLIQTMPKGVMQALIVEQLSSLTQVNAQEIIGQAPAHITNSQSRPTQQRKPNTTSSMTPVRRALSLVLQHPKLAHHFEILNPITEKHVRGIEILKNLVSQCIQNTTITTASLLERYREEPFFTTLSQLANHHHNNIESLTDDEAVTLIKANNNKLIDEFNEVELANATRELEQLNNKQKITELDSNEVARKELLTKFIRNQYNINN